MLTWQADKGEIHVGDHGEMGVEVSCESESISNL